MRTLPSWVITLLSMAVVLAIWIGITSGGLVRDLFLPGRWICGMGSWNWCKTATKAAPCWNMWG